MAKLIDSKSWQGTFVDTGKKVELPVPIDYQFLVGGACRDTLLGRLPNDYDFYFASEDIFKETIEELRALGFKCSESEVVGKKNFAKNWLRFWRKCRSRKIIYDLFLFHKLDDIESMLSGMDFTINVCYQRPHENINMLDVGFEDLKNKILEMNVSESPFGELLSRSIKFKRELEFKPGTKLITKLIEGFEKSFCNEGILNNPDKSIVSLSKNYVRVSHGEYGDSYIVKRRKLFNDLFDVIGKEYLPIAFLSSHNYLLTLAKRKYNQLQKQERGSWFKRLFRFLLKKGDN